MKLWRILLIPGNERQPVTWGQRVLMALISSALAVGYSWFGMILFFSLIYYRTVMEGGTVPVWVYDFIFWVGIAIGFIPLFWQANYDDSKTPQPPRPIRTPEQKQTLRLAYGMCSVFMVISLLAGAYRMCADNNQAITPANMTAALVPLGPVGVAIAVVVVVILIGSIPFLQFVERINHDN